MNFITELYIVSALQLIIAIGLLNVWLARFHKPTKYRGAGAGNMEQEFRAYINHTGNPYGLCMQSVRQN
jgi:hypothetical protein